MFGIGDTELLLIALFAFFLFGPDKLPELGKNVSKGLKHIKSAQDSVTKVVQEQMIEPMQKATSEVNDSLTDTAKKAKDATKPSVAKNAHDPAPSQKPAQKTPSFAEQKQAAEKTRLEARELYGLHNHTSEQSSESSQGEAKDGS